MSGYTYRPSHSESDMLAGVKRLGWRVARASEGTSRCRVELTSPCGTFGWAGAFGAFAFLHSVGVIDLGRELQPFDENDVRQGRATWGELRACRG